MLKLRRNLKSRLIISLIATITLTTLVLLVTQAQQPKRPTPPSPPPLPIGPFPNGRPPNLPTVLAQMLTLTPTPDMSQRQSRIIKTPPPTATPISHYTTVDQTPNLPEDEKVQIYASKPNGQVERYLVAPAEMDETLALLELSYEILFMEVPSFMVPGGPAPFIPPTASPVLGRVDGSGAQRWQIINVPWTNR